MSVDVETKIENGFLICLHPPGPCGCPVDECEWETEENSASPSLDAHLVEEHGFKDLIRQWSCRTCSHVMFEPEIRFHRMRCGNYEARPTPETGAKSFFHYTAENGLVLIPFPTPLILKCNTFDPVTNGICKSGRFTSKTRESNVVSHLANCHESVATVHFQCELCDAVIPNLSLAKAHHEICKVAMRAANLSDLVDSSFNGECLTLMYPGKPTRCPICLWLTEAEGTKVAVSFGHHFFKEHNRQIKWDWKCRLCNFEGDGYKMRDHHKKHHASDLNSSQSSSISPAISLVIPSPVPANSSRNSLLDRIFNSPLAMRLRRGNPSSSPNPPIPIQSPQDKSDSLISNSSSSPHSSSSSSSSFTSPTTFISSTSTSPSSSPDTNTSPGGSVSSVSSDSFSSPQSSPRQQSAAAAGNVRPAAEFYLRWGNRFDSISSTVQLNDILLQCCNDWIKCSSNPSETIPAPSNPKPKSNPTSRARNQSRQQQRVRRSGKREGNRKRHMQRLFSIYPRRAVRKILGEVSVPYSGTREDAEKFLHDTYSRPPPTEAQVLKARSHYDSCDWAAPAADDNRVLSAPPSAREIKLKLGKASNTAPGKDGLEYRHLRALDPNGELLAAIYRAVWKHGIPDCWRTSRTVPIFKKGDPTDFSNFRPISLLPTIYKIFSGVISSRIMAIATRLGWMSPEQKGFLPGVRGIQEHTHILHAVIEESKRKRKDMVIAWLDLSNAFGSVPHPILNSLFQSLPIPEELRKILNDIYSQNIMEFAVGQDTIPVHPLAGVRQGDPLSSVVFNLAAEPLIRTAKASNDGFSLFGTKASVTAYADDIAIISSNTAELQDALDATDATACDLGLSFNPGKCTSLSHKKGKNSSESHLHLRGSQIRSMKKDEHEDYLGTPMGSRLTFRPATSLRKHLILIADSGLAPWQKLEVLRSSLLPSLSHHLASGRVLKDSLYQLDVAIRDFLRRISNLPMAANSKFFYSDRRVGGLGLLPLVDEADIWTIARAIQLLDSSDTAVAEIAMAQLEKSIRIGYGKSEVPTPLPINEYLSGSMDKGLMAVRHGGGRENLWTRARKAAISLKGVRIDVSGEEYNKIIADDISVVSLKAVRGLRTALRQRWTEDFMKDDQGRVAAGLALEKSKDTAAMVSCRTPLSFQDWHYIHRARLGILPVKCKPGSKISDQKCRLGCGKDETSHHVVSCCQVNMVMNTKRHDSILSLLATEAEKHGHRLTVNKAADDNSMRPDLLINSVNPPLIIDVTVPFDIPNGMERAHGNKMEKYRHLGPVLPLVVGALGSWLPTNDEIAIALGFSRRKWSFIRRKMKLLAIQGTTRIIANHLARAAAVDPDYELDELAEEEAREMIAEEEEL